MREATDILPGRADPDFVAQNRRLCWKDDQGEEHWSQLYTPSPEALCWDGVPEGALDAMGSRFGAYLYLKLEVTGRKDTQVFDRRNFSDPMGRRVQITFTSTSSDGVEFTDTATGWVVDRLEA